MARMRPPTAEGLKPNSDAASPKLSNCAARTNTSSDFNGGNLSSIGRGVRNDEQ